MDTTQTTPASALRSLTRLAARPRRPDNPVVFVNNAFCRPTGYERQEMLGRNCRFLQGPETDPATTARLRAAVKAEQGLEVGIRNYRKDGTTCWSRLLVAPVRDAGGWLAYFFASQVDMTLGRERLAGLSLPTPPCWRSLRVGCTSSGTARPGCAGYSWPGCWTRSVRCPTPARRCGLR